MTDKTKTKTMKEKLGNSHYQPSKAEKEQEYNMPNLSNDQVRSAFFESKNVGRQIK